MRQVVPIGWRYISREELAAMSDRDIHEAAADAADTHVAYGLWRDRLFIARKEAQAGRAAA